MTNALLRALIAFSMALTLAISSRWASAEPSQEGVALGVEPSLDVQLAPLHAASVEHPWGTAALAWHAADASSATRLWIGEWDLRAGRFVRVRALRVDDGGDGAIRLARNGDSLLLLVSGLSSPRARTALIQVGLDLVEQGSVSLADGFLGSLVVGDRFIAAATYEDDNYHLRLFDPATLVVLAARKLQGPFTPWPAPELSSHALRLEAGRLYVALARRDPSFVELRLPSLATASSMVFPVPLAHRWPYTSAALSAAPAALSFDSGNDRYLLSGDLRLLASLPPARVRVRVEGEASAGERVTQRMFGRTVSTAVRQGRWVLRVAR